MSSTGNLAWLYHLLGWTLAAAGLFWFFWALFRDRSRGKKRCPKCWYDMVGLSGLRCPECGHEVSDERELCRTKRRWRLAIVGIVAAIGGHIVASAPNFEGGGWTALVPSSVLVAIAPPNAATPVTTWFTASRITIAGTTTVTRTPGPPGPAVGFWQRLTDETWRRLGAASMWSWQEKVFVRRRLSGFQMGNPVRLPERWVKHELIPVDIKYSNIGGFIIRARDSRGRVLTSPRDYLDADHFRRPDAGVLVDFDFGTRTVDTRRITLNPNLADDWKSLLIPLSDARTNDAVRRALSPIIVLTNDTPILVVGDRSDADAWNAVGFSLVYSFEIRAGEEIIGRGKGHAEWGHTVWKDWEEPAIEWMPGGIAKATGNLMITFRGDPTPPLAEYVAYPFDKGRAAYWTGEFTMPLKPGPHPGDTAKQRVEKK